MKASTMEANATGYIFYDDIFKECTDGTWFALGMTKEEKIEARRPWLNNIIVKLIGRTICYHYLWRH